MHSSDPPPQLSFSGAKTFENAFFVDRGGTFSDGVWRHQPSGRVRVGKVLSGPDSSLQVIRALLKQEGHSGDEIPPSDVRLGTTLVTNALLERKGADVALVTTTGFGDLIRIGDQSRPTLFSFRKKRAVPIPYQAVELDIRRDREGRLQSSLDLQRAREALSPLPRSMSIAVALPHAHRFPDEEAALVRLAEEMGFAFVVASHHVSQVRGLLARAETALLDAHLGPTLDAFVHAIQGALPGSQVRFLRSSGALVSASEFRPRDAVLSGPAGGAVATEHLLRAAGAGAGIGLDMGGTSADVCRVDALGPGRSTESRVGGLTVRAPSVDVRTVAAGGGSLVRRAGDGSLSVGPWSAGASPGPIAYGRGGAEATLTDAACILGRLGGAQFPFPLDVVSAQQAFQRLAQGTGLSPLDVADAAVDVAVEEMASAITRRCEMEGHNASDHVLVPFGGAAGQYACRVARRLGIRTLLGHPAAGALSAWGIGLSKEAWQQEVGLHEQPLAKSMEALVTARQRLQAEVDGRIPPGTEPDIRYWLALRYHGVQETLALPLGGDSAALSADDIADAFDAAHRARFGYARARPLRLVSLRVHAEWGDTSWHDQKTGEDSHNHHGPTVAGRAQLYVGGSLRSVPLWTRAGLRAEASTPEGAIEGPALITDATSTWVVESGFWAHVDDRNVLVLTDRETAEQRLAASSESQVQPGDGHSDAHMLRTSSLVGHSLRHVAEGMGTTLRRCASSPNMRDRLDYSCAIFDETGALLANAPHIPVHLGAMSATVRSLLAAAPQMAPGDFFATNDPRAGGSHLPDITVVTPVFVAGQRVAFVAARGHHADVGGTTPGSMPPHSRTLGEEGVVLRHLRIAREGALLEEEVRRHLQAGPYPARDPDTNLADLRAQMAACAGGAEGVKKLVQRFGRRSFAVACADLLRRGDAGVRAVIAARFQHADAVSPLTFRDAMDDGTTLAVSLWREGDRLVVDFAGTEGAPETNQYAPRAVVDACLLYVFRCLSDAQGSALPLPLNDGCLRPIEVRVPAGCLLDPPEGAAVAAGNVETSQRVVDVLLAALGVAAGSQGTMNNVTLGDAHRGYYETLGGGSGAGHLGESFDGPSGAHVHMTNSRITDVEVLEETLPILLRRFSFRAGSGGEGKYRGGDGLVRAYQALAPLDGALLAERRKRAPMGLRGGQSGAKGHDTIQRKDGTSEHLTGRAVFHLVEGDILRVETPGGGGYGVADA